MMKKVAKKIVPTFSATYYFLLGLKSGLDNVRGLVRFKKQFRQFSGLAEKSDKRFDLNWNERLPYLTDATSETPFDRHYIYHPAWAARILAKTKPSFHIDISSTLHFCATVSAFIPVKFYDYRPADLALPNLTSERADLMTLPFENNSVQSISCMHTIEHIGLGRYGDPLDYDGDIKAINELMRVTAADGDILFVTPVGKPAIRFNGHRIYAYEQIIQYFSDCTLMNFALIPDKGVMLNDADPALVKDQEYGCGCFWFKKNKQ